ncbi:MAG: histidine phosphatase family protein, partial [Eubacterium sp.]|nr:histidine phosphatase family protein [Eubacterium sp.]
MKELFFIRHGRQDSKLCNTDVSLSREGREQAKLAALRLKNYGMEKIYSSDLKRAMETAEIIADELGLSYEVLQDIEEIHFGGF